MIIIIDQYGVNIEKDNNCFLISQEENIRCISPLKVTAFHIYKPVQITSPAIILAAENNIPILFLDATAKVKSMLWHTRSGSISIIRKQQYKALNDETGELFIKKSLTLKIIGHIEHLSHIAKKSSKHFKILQKPIEQLQNFHTDIIKEITSKELAVIEAQAGKTYWQAINKVTDGYLSFEKRSKHPAHNAYNALLNYGYGMLYHQVYLAIITAGLDPYLGIMHVDEYNTPSFSFDAIEPFRPWIDTLVYQCYAENEMNHLHFEQKENAFLLNKEGKKIFIPLYQNMMDTATYFNGKRVKRKDQIQFYLTQYAQQLKQTFQTHKTKSKKQ